jgi:hypothetical protein
MAKGEDAERLARCRTCSIGARHAGEQVVEYSSLYQTPICPRCRRGATRMIGDQLCVSCYNREREWAIDRNAKGTRPTIALDPRRLGLILDYGGQARYAEICALTSSTLELMVQTLRTAPARVAFCRPTSARPPVPLADLAKLFSAPAAQRSAA